MKRAAVISASVLFLASAGAWVEWTSEEPVDLEGKVVLLQGDAETITAVRWISDDSEATISRKQDDRGSYFWVDYTRWSKQLLPADRSGDDTGEATEEEERTATRSAFKSAAKTDDLMASLSPMVAQRSLDVTQADKLEEIGLTEPSATIEIDRGGRTQKLSVGGEAYGTRDYYVRHEETGKVYLVDRTLIQPLKYARTRLPDRTLFDSERANLSAITISDASRSLDLVHLHPDDAQKAGWASKAEPDVALAQPTTWVNKFLGLKGTRYSDPDAPPEGLEDRFSVALTDRDVRTTIAVKQVGSDGDWYAESEHTRGLIKLVRSTASGLTEDLDGLLGE